MTALVRFAFLTMLLLLVGGQARSANCEIRCSMPSAGAGHHHAMAGPGMAGCAGMGDGQAAFSGPDAGCVHSGCESVLALAGCCARPEVAPGTTARPSVDGAIALAALRPAPDMPDRRWAVRGEGEGRSVPRAERPAMSLRV